MSAVNRQQRGTRRVPRVPKERSRPPRSRNQTYRGRRSASGPLSSEFGIPTHVDSRGREYRPLKNTVYGDIVELACRVVGPGGRLRRPRGTAPGFPRSRSGGPWNPKFPVLDQELQLFRLSDQVLCFGRVEQVWARPHGGITARIVLHDPGLQCHNHPVSDPSRYASWVGGGSQRSRRDRSLASGSFLPPAAAAVDDSEISSNEDREAAGGADESPPESF